MRKTTLLATLMLSAALVACQPPTTGSKADNGRQETVTEDQIKEGAKRPTGDTDAIASALEAKFGGPIKVEEQDSAVPGFRQMLINGEIHYTDPAGRYLLRGEVLDLQTGTNLTQQSTTILRSQMLKELPEDQAIVFGPAKAERTLIVFTDVECGYCRRFHEQINDYIRQGIQVHYYPWPRSGLSGPVHDEMVSVWCAKDRNAALTRSKQGKGVPSNVCEAGQKIVAESVALGHRLAIRGTPAIFLPTGEQVGGYVPPEQIISVIDQATAATSP